MMQWIDGGIAAVPGFLAAGVHSGIKRSRRDVALVYSQVPASAAGVFTRNLVKAEPLLLTREHLADGRAQAVVVNSANANACTGEKGKADARRMAEMVAQGLGISLEDVVVASTGVIGVPLPMEKIEAGIARCLTELSPAGGSFAAEAIMTTDTHPKEVALQLDLKGTTVTIGGMAKGSGMIHPNMATMLAFAATDALIEPGVLQEMWREAVDQTFNMITVDGDTSTNDMAVVLANGQAGNPPLTPDIPGYQEFKAGVLEVCRKLSAMIARDGEGATKLLAVRVEEAPSLEAARVLGRTVARSNLVKSAVFGADANWGRIITAAGYSGASFDPSLVDIFFLSKGGTVQVASKGTALEFDEALARRVLEEEEITIEINLHQGQAQATALGCDLTYDYVKINADYRT